MPADSERPAAPALPRTWRPFGVRVAVWLFGGLLFLVIAAVWVGLGQDLRSQFTAFQRSTLVLMALLLIGSSHALIRSRITATEEGLTIVNGYRTRHYEWSQVISASLRRGAPWATIDLSDGTTVSALGLQGSDGERARQAIRELRATIAARTPPRA